MTLVRVIVAVARLGHHRRRGRPGYYLAAWVIIPEEGETTSIAQNLIGKKQDA